MEDLLRALQKLRPVLHHSSARLNLERMVIGALTGLGGAAYRTVYETLVE